MLEQKITQNERSTSKIHPTQRGIYGAKLSGNWELYNSKIQIQKKEKK